MKYTRVPLLFKKVEPDSEKGNKCAIQMVRDIDGLRSLLNNLVELIVFTPRGSFDGDPDFGFEYWNNEYSNKQFSDSTPKIVQFDEVIKSMYQDSIRDSLLTYAPQLKKVNVSISLNPVDVVKREKKKSLSKYVILITINGSIADELGAENEYKKEVRFYIEPTVKIEPSI